jgi:hypothetical protein
MLDATNKYEARSKVRSNTSVGALSNNRANHALTTSAIDIREYRDQLWKFAFFPFSIVCETAFPAPSLVLELLLATARRW